MHYQSIEKRFLRDDERLILSQETEMPLVIEAKERMDVAFLQQYLTANSKQVIDEMAKYGAVLLRGFNVQSEEEFEKIILSIPEFQGINNAFMAENGRVPVTNLKYVLHTNSVYKTGGTVYLGGFHTENYYSADVPSYLNFCCFTPSEVGGETGLINTEKIYSHLSNELQQKLEKKPYFVCKWMLSEVAEQFQTTLETVRTLCTHFALPIIGQGEDQFVLMYKPSVLEHPLTKEKALQINMFELPTLNDELRKCFMQDYQGNTWFWHRFFWKLPSSIFNAMEYLAYIFIAFFNSPKKSYKMFRRKLNAYSAIKKASSFDKVKVGSCFSKQDVRDLAQLMRQYYSSCLWKKGDILLIDNKKVMHAGMPGKGPRLIRAMICNPIEMNYSASAPGYIKVKERETHNIGACIVSGKVLNNPKNAVDV